jgi:transcriptional regulator with XRE-family HTH domain
MSSRVQRAKEDFGAGLRELRKDANLSGRALAAATGMHFTKISRLEHGRQNPSEDDIRRWCHACDAEDQIPELIATLRGIEGMWIEWRRKLGGGLRRLQQSHDPLYEQASLIRAYESIVVPGILQTAGYSEAVLRLAAQLYDADGDIGSAVEARMERQRFLYRGDRRFVFVVEAWALQALFGSVDVMLGQLDRLLAVMTLPRVSFGIIPPTTVRKVWPGEGFWIYDDAVAVVETTSAEIKVVQPRELALFSRTFKLLQDQAVYGTDARDLIAGIMQDFVQLHETS